MTKILFVCHGNICRSPMAEFVMKKLAENSCTEIYTESAAVSREEIGNPVYPPACRKLAEHGISCAGKTARQMTREDYDRFDLLVGMDQSNLIHMKHIFGGDPDHKLRLLLSFCGYDRDVDDPWYSGDFEQTWQDILAGCTAILQTYISAKP